MDRLSWFLLVTKMLMALSYLTVCISVTSEDPDRFACLYSLIGVYTVLQEYRICFHEASIAFLFSKRCITLIRQHKLWGLSWSILFERCFFKSFIFDGLHYVTSKYQDPGLMYSLLSASTVLQQYLLVFVCFLRFWLPRTDFAAE